LGISTSAGDLLPIAQTSEPAPLPAPTNEPTSIPTPAVDTGAGAGTEAELAAASQNPIANLISVPFQFNTNFGTGAFDRVQEVINIQPVIPTRLSNDLLLVSRIIVPLVIQPGPTFSSGSIFGLGDINPQFFFVPYSAGSLTWGVGPIFLFPTATDGLLGTGKWGAGPTAEQTGRSASRLACCFRLARRL
jgi:hypothetical protein